MADINLEVNKEWDSKKLDKFIENVEQAQGMLTYQTDYAVFVEIDTSYNGSQPPFEPIRDWVVRNITEGAITASDEEYESIDDIAWAIVNHIAKNGTEGVYFVTFTEQHIKNNWADIIGNYDGDLDAPEKIVRDLLNEMLDYSQKELQESDKIDTGNLIDSGITIFGVKPDDESVSVDKI